MPKQIKEIKNFHTGTIINTSENDIADDTPSFSLNVNPIAEGGILDSINNDKVSFTTDNKITRLDYPFSWGEVNERGRLNNIEVFDSTKDFQTVQVIGTKGRLEKIKLYSLKPDLEHIILSASQSMTFRPLEAGNIIPTSTTMSYLSDTNAITGTAHAGNTTIAGFTDGTATIAIDTADVTTLAGKTIIITTPDRKQITYTYFNDGSGATNSSLGKIQLNGLTTDDEIAEQTELAIEHHTHGHHNRIIVSRDTNTPPVLTLTYAQLTMDNYLFKGDYFALHLSTDNFDTKLQNNQLEIIRIKSVDTVNRIFTLERGAFGTNKNGYINTNDYHLYANRVTIDSNQIPTNKGSFKVSEWSNYSGNNIGGKGLWAISSSDGSARMDNGLITNDTTFSSSSKTMVIASQRGNINEGDTVTFYYGADGSDEPNNGKSFTVIKKVYSAPNTTWTFDTAPADDVVDVSSTPLYFEINLIKNHTFHHASDEINPTVEVGNAQTKKVNKWNQKFLTNNNVYTQTNTEGLIERVSSGGYWEDTTAEHGADSAELYYPFSEDDAYMSILSFYSDTGKDLLSSCTAEDDSLFLGFKDIFAVNDIIKIDSEYMRIINMNESITKVDRAILGSTAASHSTGASVSKGLNPTLSQVVDASSLKTGQSYSLTFMAKDLYSSSKYGYGAVSVRYNGGYVTSGGEFQQPSQDQNLGYINNRRLISQESRWINFKDLNTVAGDSADNIDSGLDTTWRRFELLIHLPKNTKILTGLEIEFSSRGVSTSKIGLDNVDLSEINYICPESSDSEVSSVGSIDNSGQKDLVLFDNKNKSLGVVKDFKELESNSAAVDFNIEKSPFAASNVESHSNKASFVSRNRETHIGFGPKAEDSKPQWLGYLNNKIFGTDNSNNLYQDEDTVHGYDSSGLITMSKVALAGEFENLAGVVSSTGSIGDSNTILTVTHTNHGQVVGNNLVVREYQDIDNSWDGNGVWVVTTRTDDDEFICKRIVSKDAQPTAVASNNKISYRPYYYYGIKDGDNHLYRIIPDTIYTDESTVSTKFTKGKIEKSLSLPYLTSSICSSYQKEDTSGGGRVYVLTSSGEIKIIDIRTAYDSWELGEPVLVSTMTLLYKAYKWSNDDVSGNVNGDTEVYGGLSDVSTPDIATSGIISDILETKGPTSTFNQSSTNKTDNVDADFSTRLWVQFRPANGETFSSSDRFLFCGITTGPLNTNGAEIYLGDRTPPTNIVMGKRCRWDTSGDFFSAGPGLYTGNSHLALNDNRGDMPLNEIANHAIFSFSRHGGSHSEGYRKEKISKIGVITTAGHDNLDSSWYDEVGSLYAGYNKVPNINFGNNVGWDGAGGIFPSIFVAKYGLIPIGDSNCDGILDGTGLIVPSSTTLPDTLYNRKLGPWGYEHEKVCAHAVGIIGGSESPWVRDFGALTGKDFSISGGRSYLRGADGNGPENMSVEKCLFICSDVHFGDYNIGSNKYSISAFGGVNWDSLGANTATIITISTTKGIQPGSQVVINLNGSIQPSCTVLKVDSTTQFTVGMSYTSQSTTNAFVYLNSITYTYSETINTPTYNGNKGINHFHWAYNKQEPENGDIFTNRNLGGGHYSKTWWTQPDLFGQSPSVSETSVSSPGYLHRIERLNYRAGYMIRPFDLDDNTFEDLLLGNGLCIDAAVRPEAIFHKETGGKTHDGISGDIQNQFASKIFISSPLPDTYDETNKSKLFICDPTFEYPDILHQIEVMRASGNSGTNEFNDNYKSYTHYLYGKITSYTKTAATGGVKTKINATANPYITINPAECQDDNSLLAANTRFRASNRFAGNMISIINQTTGHVQTRQIVSSDVAGSSATDNLFIGVHFPFGHEPADDDLFYIWSHRNACTSSIRLFREKELDLSFNSDGIKTKVFKADPIIGQPIYKSSGDIATIDGDTATITVTSTANHNLSNQDVIIIYGTENYDSLGPQSVTVTSPKIFTISGTFSDVASESVGKWDIVSKENSTSGVSNPVKIPLAQSVLKTTFGGLDMRKSRGLIASVVDDNTIDNATITSSNDGFTFNGALAAHDGVYEIIDKNTDDFDVSNVDTNNNTTDAQPITINQWESIAVAGEGSGLIGEVRVGLNKLDTGSIQGNLSRKDSETSIKSNLYLSSSEASVLITTPSVGNETNDYFLKNREYQYRVSLTYDGYQEGPLSKSTYSFLDTDKTREKLRVKLSIKTYSKRLTHVNLYRRDNKDSFYSLVKSITTKGGWSFDGNIYQHTVEDSGSLKGSYEARTGRSETLNDITLKYGISCEIDGYLFAANCSHNEIKNASNQIFRSKPGMYSVFDFSVDFLQLKSKPTALANFAGRLFAFDNNNIYKINQQSLAVEDIFEGIGCLGQESVIVTEYGMFFADRNGAYLHDGSNPKKISEPIENGGDSSNFTDLPNISWNTLVGTELSSIPKVIFDSNISSVLFFMDYPEYDAVDYAGFITNVGKRTNYCWSFNLMKNRWDLWEVSEDTFVGAPFIGDKGAILIPISNIVYEFKGGSSKRDYTWLSKKFTMEEDSIVKVYNKVKINGVSENLTLDGNYKESSDRLLIKTNVGDINSSDITYSEESSGNSEYKIKSANKKGRWMQLKLNDMTTPLESIGIIYRRKSTK